MTENALQQLFKSQFHLEFNGNREVIVEDCSGILEYTKQQIRINTADCILRFQGKDLEVCAMTQDSIVLKGFIHRVEFMF